MSPSIIRSFIVEKKKELTTNNESMNNNRYKSKVSQRKVSLKYPLGTVCLQLPLGGCFQKGTTKLSTFLFDRHTHFVYTKNDLSMFVKNRYRNSSKCREGFA